jgi:hypothetical protein
VADGDPNHRQDTTQWLIGQSITFEGPTWGDHVCHALGIGCSRLVDASTRSAVADGPDHIPGSYVCAQGSRRLGASRRASIVAAVTHGDPTRGKGHVCRAGLATAGRREQARLDALVAAVS